MEKQYFSFIMIGKNLFKWFAEENELYLSKNNESLYFEELWWIFDVLCSVTFQQKMALTVGNKRFKELSPVSWMKFIIAKQKELLKR